MSSVAKAVLSVIVAQALVGAATYVAVETGNVGIDVAIYIGWVLGPAFVLIVYTVAIRELIDARIELFADRALTAEALDQPSRQDDDGPGSWRREPADGRELVDFDGPPAAAALLEDNPVVTRRELEQTWPADSGEFDSAEAWWDAHLEPTLERHPHIEQLDGTGLRWSYDPD